MKYPVSEAMDRLSIERLKQERAEANNQEISTKLIIHCNNNIIDKVSLIKWQTSLHKINGMIWDLESDIRKGKEGELGLEEVGRRALAIRDLNGVRISIKNEIAESLGENKEQKFNHASE